MSREITFVSHLYLDHSPGYGAQGYLRYGRIIRGCGSISPLQIAPAEMEGRQSNREGQSGIKELSRHFHESEMVSVFMTGSHRKACALRSEQAHRLLRANDRGLLFKCNLEKHRTDVSSLYTRYIGSAPIKRRCNSVCMSQRPSAMSRT